MKERIIWRPNEITPEVWDTFSREQQIQCWKEHTARTPKEPPAHPLRAQRLYDAGHITKCEISRYVFEHLTEDNIQEFLHGCSDEILCHLRQEVEELPANDDQPGWSRIVFHQMGSYFPWVTNDEIQRAKEERDRRFREAVKLFRAHLQNRHAL